MEVAKLIKTAIVLLAMLDAGINIGLFSPTFPAMQVLTSSTTTEISTTLTWIGVTSAIGAVLSGPVFDRFNGYATLAVALLAQGVAIGLAPWCRVLIGYQIMSAIACIFNFAIMCGTLSVNCNLWLDSPHLIGPIVQTTDLVHALGAAFAPQIIAPFLVQHNDPATQTPTDSPYATSTSSTLRSGSYENGSMIAVTNGTETSGVQPVQMAYVLIAAIDVIVAIICAVTCVVDRYGTRPRDVTYDAYSSTEAVEQDDDDPPTTTDVTDEILPRQSHRHNSANDGGALPVSDLRAAAMAARQRVAAIKQGSRPRHYSEVTQLTQHPRERSWTLASVDSSLYVRNHPDVLAITVAIGRKDATPSVDVEAPGPSTSSPSTVTGVSKIDCRTAFVLVAILMYFAVNGARDAIISGLLFTYVVEYAGWSTGGATLLVTGYHVTRVVVHVVVVLVARWVTSFKMSVFNVVVLLASSVFLVSTVRFVGHGFFTTGIILTGFATSNVHATAITLARDSFEVNGMMMGLFIGSIAFGQCVVSPIAGVLMQDVGTLSFPVLLLALSTLSAIFLTAWTLLHRFLIRRRPEMTSSSENDANEKTPLLHH